MPVAIKFRNSFNPTPFSVRRIKEVKFFGGVADATAFLDHNWMPEEGFQKQMAYNNGWHVGPIKGPRQAMNLPVMVWYDFKTRKISPAEVRTYSTKWYSNCLLPLIMQSKCDN